jgi:hypothetical protein
MFRWYRGVVAEMFRVPRLGSNMQTIETTNPIEAKRARYA